MPAPDLENLQQRIDALKPPTPDAQDNEASSRNSMGRGLQVGLELVAGVGVGTYLGYVADAQLGSKPWGMIIGFMFGTAAGFRNLMRSAQ